MSIRTQVYGRLSKAFKVTVTEVFDDQGEHVTFIPPFSTLVLEASDTLEDIPDKLLEVREQYTKLRQRMYSLDEERVAAKTFKERKRCLIAIRNLLDTAAKKFQQPNTLRLETLIRYIPEVTKPLVAPTDPSSYSA